MSATKRLAREKIIVDPFPLPELLCNQQSWNCCSQYLHTASTSDDTTKNICSRMTTLSETKCVKTISVALEQLLSEAFLHLLYRVAQESRRAHSITRCLACFQLLSLLCFMLMKVACKLRLYFYFSCDLGFHCGSDKPDT